MSMNTPVYPARFGRGDEVVYKGALCGVALFPTALDLLLLRPWRGRTRVKFHAKIVRVVASADLALSPKRHFAAGTRRLY